MSVLPAPLYTKVEAPPGLSTIWALMLVACPFAVMTSSLLAPITNWPYPATVAPTVRAPVPAFIKPLSVVENPSSVRVAAAPV